MPAMPTMPYFGIPIPRSTPGAHPNMSVPQGSTPERNPTTPAPYRPRGDTAGWDPVARPPS
eukprot:3547125-Prorocentrum_lima.AAC.1